MSHPRKTNSTGRVAPQIDWNHQEPIPEPPRQFSAAGECRSGHTVLGSALSSSGTSYARSRPIPNVGEKLGWAFRLSGGSLPPACPARICAYHGGPPMYLVDRILGGKNPSRNRRRSLPRSTAAPSAPWRLRRRSLALLADLVAQRCESLVLAHVQENARAMRLSEAWGYLAPELRPKRRTEVAKALAHWGLPSTLHEPLCQYVQEIVVSRLLNLVLTPRSTARPARWRCAA